MTLYLTTESANALATLLRTMTGDASADEILAATQLHST
jgi:hypothetical protein